MSLSPELQISNANGVARIVVSNPARRNALTVALKHELLGAFSRLEQDPETRCIVLTGAGTKSFISGADISEFEKVRANPAAEAEYMQISMAVMMSPAVTAKPVIASIRGACAGAGLQLAVACDIRIASREAYFFMPAAKLGAPYPYPAIGLFVSLLGRGKAADLFMSGRKVPAQEAFELGLVNQIVDDNELDDAVAAYAAVVAANAPLTLRLVKESIKGLTAPLQVPPSIQPLLDACAASQDLVEGRTAFLEKRTPAFKGN